MISQSSSVRICQSRLPTRKNNAAPGRKSGQKGKIMDCSKTIDFFAEAKRLCDSRTACMADAANKERCPLLAFCRSTFTTRRAEETITAIKNLQKWSNEHAKKTYKQDFLEKFPDAPKYESVNSRHPRACRISIYDGECPGTGCDECWNEPMNDE